ncbi:unnamed protein product, partial [Iphiclides podalirius]
MSSDKKLTAQALPGEHSRKIASRTAANVLADEDCGIDTGGSLTKNAGSDLCVYPRSAVKQNRAKMEYQLFAANGTSIATYGYIHLQLNFDLRNYRLIDGLTNLSTVATSAAHSVDIASIKAVSGDTVYHQLLRVNLSTSSISGSFFNVWQTTACLSIQRNVNLILPHGHRSLHSLA